ncbi:MAG: MarR family transcriptional regulator [Candidatus Mcinerneyibacterium aminivorans]|uniref:MarR family transcriptional regulator n=1 Tax=Candidatus Mcinerneyibacterium aminivorans TaxID=2703815 RepID=A0A5D0MEU1_9BACT|nr:MAG: MarR family transcriptional regulator [Candidatus Mcinerneyibacterium aminivorans]
MKPDNLCKIKNIFKKIYKFENNLQKKFNLSINEILTICSLSNLKMSSTELATEIGVSPSRMSRILKKLESKNYIKRTLSKNDKRKMMFNLTEKGKEKVRTVHDTDINIPKINTKK